MFKYILCLFFGIQNKYNNYQYNNNSNDNKYGHQQNT